MPDDVPAAGTRRGLPGAAAPRPAAPSVSTKRMLDAVKWFKEAVNISGVAAPANITMHGQFFWFRTLLRAMDPKIAELAKLDDAAKPFVTLLKSLDFPIVRRDVGVPDQLKKLDRMAQDLPVNAAARAAMRALVSKPVGVSAGLEDTLWKRLDGDRANAMPAIDPQHISVHTVWAHALWSKGICGSYAARVAARALRRSGRKAAPGKGMQRSLIGGSPWGMQNDAVRDGRMLGDIVYQRDTAAVVDAMMRALDDGRLIHARVLSGVGYGGKTRLPTKRNERGEIVSPVPPEEHSLVIIGHNGTDTFFFHDPDATRSTTPERGFGTLFHDPAKKRLSTAASEAGLPVDKDGLHPSGAKRYQVLSVFTF